MKALSIRQPWAWLIAIACPKPVALKASPVGNDGRGLKRYRLSTCRLTHSTVSACMAAQLAADPETARSRACRTVST